MCSRYTVYVGDQNLAELFDAQPQLSLPYKAGDILLTNNAPCVRWSNGRRELVGLRWWLVPAKGPGIQSKYPMFNARVETAAEKISFCDPFRNRRCLLLTTGWVEGKTIGGTPKKPIKEKYVMKRADLKPFALAGLWDRWEGDDKVIESCTMLMTDAVSKFAPIHERMPIILPPSTYDTWLDPELTGVDAVKSLLVSATEEVDAVPFVPA